MKKVLSTDAYKEVHREATSGGKSATHAGEQRMKEGKGLHELVDPKGFGVIRRSLNRFLDENGKLILTNGVAMLKETRFDTTSSMGSSIDEAFKSLPRSYNLIAIGDHAVLGRYDTQIITSMFNDVCDNNVLLRSQAEMDVKIAEQMTLMVPERDGGDFAEDPQYGLFGAAYFTAADINRYGLKSYDFTVSDATGRNFVDAGTVKRVFGNDAFKIAAENGFPIDEKNMPTTYEVVKDLLKRSHAFFLQVYNHSETTEFWTKLFGRERVIKLPSTELLPEVEAAIIGLTEGTLTLQTVEEFLIKEAGLSASDALLVKRAVAGIPIGAQMALPNFEKIPAKGSVFANKRDLYPTTSNEEENSDEVKSKMW